MAEYYTSTKHFRDKVGKSQTVPTTDGYWYHGNGKLGGEFHPTKPNDEEHYGEYVKVVHCKDCVNFYKYGFKLEYTECKHFDCDVCEDGFCAWGSEV